MAGWDTLRGIGFQHAVALLEAVKLLEDPLAVELRVEGTVDIVDIQTRTQTHVTSVQVRSRQEPYTWQPADLATVVRAWAAASPPDYEELRFVSDAPLSRDSARRLLPAIERTARSAASAADRELLNTYDLSVDPDVLRRVRFETRAAPTSALLVIAAQRLLSLLQASRHATTADAEDAVARLFQQVAVRGGESEPERRTFTRAELAEIVGVDLPAVDAGDVWDQAARHAYLAEIVRPADEDDALVHSEPAITASGVRIQLTVAEEGREPGAITFGAPLQVLELSIVPQLGLVGVAGSGKSTSLHLLVHELASHGALPLLISVAAYVESDLTPRVQRMIERTLKRTLRPRAAEEALSSNGAVLLLDGLTGLQPDDAKVLVRDVRRLRERFPSLRVIATDRDARLLRQLGLTMYELKPLDDDQRLALANAVVGAGAAPDALEMIGNRLPAALANPLLLTMALRLLHANVDLSTRASLYRSAISALQERSDDRLLDVELAAVSLASTSLVDLGQYEADQYWWLLALRAALDELTAARVFDVRDLAAESVLTRAISVGVLVERAAIATVGFLHDSFRDYFTAIALVRDLAKLPSELTESWEPAAEMLAEETGVTGELVAAARSNVVLCARLAPLDRDVRGDRLEETAPLVRFLLDSHLGRAAFGDLESVRILVCYAASYRYVLLSAADPGEDRVLPLDELTERAATARVVFALPPNRGPLSIAFGVWRELLSLATSEEDLEGRRPLPTDEADLLRLIADDFRIRQSLLPDLAERFVPTLAERVLAEIGWHGLRARLGAPIETQLGPGYVESERWLHFDTRSEVVDVAFADEDEQLDLPERAHLDDYLTETPKAASMNALVKQLERLVAREDLRG